jgi:uncharacterized membrane protein
VTVREWLDARTPPPPAALREGVCAALGDACEADEIQTTRVCLDAAERALRAILDSQRFDRDGALDLLVVDALTTYAFEYASLSRSSDLGSVANEGVRQFGNIAAAHG